MERIWKIEGEFMRNPDLRLEDVREIREWLQTQQHIPHISEFEIVLFLHSNYYELEATKMTIEHYYTCRTSYKEFFSNLDLNSKGLLQAHEAITLTVLPNPTPEGYRIIFGRLNNTDPSKFNLAHCIKLFFLFVDALLLEEGTIEGLVLAFDMTGAQIGHVFKLGLFTVKHGLHYIQEGFPIRMKQIHFFNLVSFIDKILAIVRPFMKQSLWDILYLDPKIEDTYDCIPPDVFPTDYPGGTALSVRELHEISYKNLFKYQNYFYEAERSKVTDENLRDKKSKWWF
uniref:CSON013466 protein n=1 Tax=Culicoides sonorensis TaxID=179676 RepID=A0A336M8A8_CULSO